MIVISVNPQAEATHVPQNTVITVAFDKAVDPASLSEDSIVVGTDKNNLIQIADGRVLQNDTFESDFFITDGFTAIVKGSVEIAQDDPKKIIFTPVIPLQKSTLYKIFISESILATDGDHPSKVYTSSFTTAAEDTAFSPMPKTIPTRILGTNVVFTDEGIKVQSSSPALNSVHNTKNTVTLRLSCPVKDYALRAEINDVLSDFPFELIEGVEGTHTGNTVTLTLPAESIKPNKIILITGEITGEDDTKVEISHSFYTKLDPYFLSTKYMRLKAGSIIQKVDDLSLSMSILLASAEARNYASKARGFLSAKDMNVILVSLTYALCVESMLMNNFSNPVVDFIKKDVADISMSISTKSQITLFNTLLQDARTRKSELISYLTTLASNPYIKMPSDSPNVITGRRYSADMAGINTKVIINDRPLLTWDDFVVG